MKRNCHHLLLTAWLAVTFAASAGAEDATETRRSELLKQMRDLAEQTEVAYESGAKAPELKPNPVFRYDDQPRRFIDATMWVWLDQGRPVAFQKIEAKYRGGTGAPEWGYCFGSVSPELLSVHWPGGESFRSTAPGIAFRPLPNAPPIAQSEVGRRRQLRELARQFSSRIVTDPNNNVTRETRLLTTPILVYSDEKTQAPGAVFGFAANNVNPDVLLLLEARDDAGELRWHFAPARMTSSGVTLRFGETVVWEVSWVNWDEAPFPTWTFFYTPRTPLAEEASP